MNRFNLIPKIARFTFNLCVALFIAIIILLLPGSFLQPVNAQSERPSGVSETDTVHVAPPTGERETDRASILDALEQVDPGGTIQFAPGTYLLGAGALLTVPDLTPPAGEFPDSIDVLVQQHMDSLEIPGVSLAVMRGSEVVKVAAYGHANIELDAAATPLTVFPYASMTKVFTGGAVLRLVQQGRLSIEDRITDLLPDLPHGWGAVKLRHVLDHTSGLPDLNTFQAFTNPFLALTETREEVLAALAAQPVQFAPGGGFAYNQTNSLLLALLLEQHDGRTIEQYVREEFAESLGLGSLVYGDSRRSLPARASWYTRLDFTSGLPPQPTAVRPLWIEYPPWLHTGAGLNGTALDLARFVAAVASGTLLDQTLRREMWTPARLSDGSVFRFKDGSTGAGLGWWVHDDPANYWAGMEGAASGALRHYVDERLTVVVLTNLQGSAPEKIVEEIAQSYLRGAAEEPASQPGPAVPDDAPFESKFVDAGITDTTHYTVIIDGHRKAEWRMWQKDSVTWRYEYEGNSYDSYHFPRKELLVLDSDGLPVRMEIMGHKSPWAAWEERFDQEEDTYRCTTTIDEGEYSVDGPAQYYAALHPVHDRGVLVRALLRQPSGRLPLLPDGEAWLEALGERSIATEKGIRTVRHFAVHGLDLKPVYVWLDENDATFADEWSVLSGWETAFPELRLATEAALAEHHRRLAQSLIPPDRERLLAITGARLFDPETHAVRAGTTILIDGNRIAAVGADGSVEVPPGAEVIEVAGRMVLPGLWDMHAHHGIPSVYLELDAPLHLAGGITTARDLGSHTDPILSLKERFETGEAIGPRLLLSGFIDGANGRPSGVLAGSAAEAEAVVDRFAELGFVQIKIYDQVPGELVPVIIERAAHHGLRVSGHITVSMSGREAVEAGYDELQHIDGIITGMLGSIAELMRRVEDGWTGWSEALADLQPGSEPVREFVDLLAVHGVAIDPTLAGTEAREVPPDYVAPVLDRLPPQARRRILDRFWNPHPEMIPHLDRIVSSRRGFIRVAHEAGIPVLPGTDVIPGFGYHRELELYVEAGIPAPEVLTLATLGAARVMGMDDELGSIEPGKLADLILVDGDPTTDISDIRRVMTVIKDGRVYDPAAIYRALGIEPCCEE